MQNKNLMEAQLSQKHEQIQSLTEQKQAAEDRCTRLETEVQSKTDELTKLIQAYEAKKEDHIREERKVKTLE